MNQGRDGLPVAETYRKAEVVADLSLDKEMLQDVIRRER